MPQLWAGLQRWGFRLGTLAAPSVPSEVPARAREGQSVSELAVRDEGILSRFEHTPTSLILPHDLSYEDYEGLLGFLGLLHNASRWYIADALRFGELAFEGDKYVQAAELTGLSPGRLANIASIGNRIPPSRRRPGVSFSHHEEVAPLEPEDQERFLAAAEENAWPKDVLRAEIHAELAARNGRPFFVEPEVSVEEAARAVWHASRRVVGDAYLTPAEVMQVMREALGE